MKWFIRGDTHCDFTPFYHYDKLINNPNSAVIILGDAGLNTGLNKDSHIKNKLKKRFDGWIYCVRGNHELRPSDVPEMKLIWDENVNGYVWMQDKWPQIRYFQDYAIYWINGYRCLVLGGAYSVDKWYRLQAGLFWAPNEQLSKTEMNAAMPLIIGEKFDFIFSHTCPQSWEPIDLFLNTISQNTVDHSMEIWLDEVREKCEWKVWMFGHYHCDRAERPRAEMCFNEIQDLDTVWNRWEGEKTICKEWWILKSPMYYVDGNEYEEQL